MLERESVDDCVLPRPTELAYRSIYPNSGKAGVSKKGRLLWLDPQFSTAVLWHDESMEKKKPDPKSRFAEVTKRAQEERAKKPKQKRDDPNQGIPRNLKPREE